uniref:Receptor ligand binding region domain-containing protein n=1 Tax=Biomphalaria glabrata TaxID=6526 RepID=A0A2C9KKX9_BIOGL
MAGTGLILYLFVISFVLSQNVIKPVVHIVVMESTGAQDNGNTYFVRYLKPLLDLALDDARAMFGDLIDIDMKHVETLSGLSQIGALAAKVFYKDPVHVFFGPASNEGAVTLGFMALHWNLPVLTPRGNDMRLRNITFFPTVVALHPFDKVILTKFIMKLFDKYGWKHISLFVDRDKAVMTSTFEIVNKFCIENEINCYQHILSCFNCSTLDKELLESKVSSRVNLLLMAISDVRCLLIRASSLGMLEPDFVYILPDIEGVRHENAWIWRNNDSYDQAMNAAFRRVMLIIIKTPSHAAFDAILKRLNAKMFGNDTSQYVSASFEDEVEENAGHDDTSAQQYILSGYYNSFLVYLTAVNETLAVGGNISDGISLVKRMCNRTYLGERRSR